MILRPYLPGDLSRIEAQPAQRPFLSLASLEDAESIALSGPGWTGVDETGVLIGSAGLAASEGGGPMRAWAVFSERICGRGRYIVRIVRRVLASTPAPVAALISPTHPEAARFARVVGFEFDRVIPDAHPLGDVHLYLRA